ncbi:lysozyme family protein [Virgibacillus sp. NKC19-16]|uniref:lysozyme family protein n=1 Tax=Virgibacillus salidurans TaxID=2831673 RepID=UPI001F20790E|nr:lysozyme family protein [Virgibacillus sp. NKC19-16]UJL47094.1 lysozyme family protein [Virgibacillus sp. NKC19-16]
MKGINGIFLLFFVLMMFVFLFLGSVIMVISGDDPAKEESSGDQQQTDAPSCRFNTINDDVERYRDYFEKYASENGIEDHTEILMGMTMQESGGRLADVMQSSESMGDPVNTINDPETSIEQGVSYFADVLEQAEGDTELALQAYNMGSGYIDYVEENNNGEYSQESAEAFGNEQAVEMGWGNYGDENYVDNVMRYLEGCENAEGEGDSDWGLPLDFITVTSEFGMRDHPIHNEQRLHAGIDFGCSTGDSLYAVADGTVIVSVVQNTGLGQHVKIEHASDEYSVYGHMSVISVNTWDDVKQGDKIGECGSTGASTGDHLHLEYHRTNNATNEDKEDPREVLGLEE